MKSYIFAILLLFSFGNAILAMERQEQPKNETVSVLPSDIWNLIAHYLPADSRFFNELIRLIRQDESNQYRHIEALLSELENYPEQEDIENIIEKYFKTSKNSDFHSEVKKTLERHINEPLPCQNYIGAADNHGFFDFIGKMDIAGIHRANHYINYLSLTLANTNMASFVEKICQEIMNLDPDTQRSEKLKIRAFLVFLKKCKKSIETELLNKKNYTVIAGKKINNLVKKIATLLNTKQQIGFGIGLIICNTICGELLHRYLEKIWPAYKKMHHAASNTLLKKIIWSWVGIQIGAGLIGGPILINSYYLESDFKKLEVMLFHLEYYIRYYTALKNAI